jgi:hypothetical protein
MFAPQKEDSRIGFVRLHNADSFSKGDRWLARIAFVRFPEMRGLPLLSFPDIYQVFMTLGSVWSLVYSETSTSSVSFLLLKKAGDAAPEPTDGNYSSALQAPKPTAYQYVPPQQLRQRAYVYPPYAEPDRILWDGKLQWDIACES